MMRTDTDTIEARPPLNKYTDTVASLLDELFDDAIDVEDTIWYSKTETLRDAIYSMIKERCMIMKRH